MACRRAISDSAAVRLASMAWSRVLHMLRSSVLFGSLIEEDRTMMSMMRAVVSFALGSVGDVIGARHGIMPRLGLIRYDAAGCVKCEVSVA